MAFLQTDDTDDRDDTGVPVAEGGDEPNRDDGETAAPAQAPDTGPEAAGEGSAGDSDADEVPAGTETRGEEGAGEAGRSGNDVDAGDNDDDSDEE